MRGDTWPLVGREEELAAARQALDDDSVGVLVISGDAGVGKTRLADELLTELDPAEHHTFRVMASQTAATIPYGAAAGLVGDQGSESLQESIVWQAGGRHAVLSVDDAHLLDPSTAELCHQLATAGTTQLVLTLRDGATPPESIQALQREHRTSHISVEPLGKTHVAELLAKALGDEVDAESAAELWQTSAGNVLFLRELCRTALEQEALIQQHGIWTLTRPIKEEISPRLEELIDTRVGGLRGDVHEAAVLLALGEPLPRTMLEELTSPTAVTALENQSLAVTDIAGPTSEPNVRLAHPLYAEGLRRPLGALETRGHIKRLTAAISGQSGRAAGRRRRYLWPNDRLRVAVWSVEADLPVDTDLLVAAARDALSSGDTALTERLAEAAFPDTRARLVLGEALAVTGRGTQAEEVLAPLADDPHDDLRTEVCVARLQAQRSTTLPPADVRRIAEQASSSLSDPGHRDLVDAALADALCSRGELRAAGPLALRMIESANPTARNLAIGPSLQWLVGSGRCEDAVTAGRRALRDALAHQFSLRWAPSLVVAHLGSALLSTARFEELDQLCTMANSLPLAPTGSTRGNVALLQGSAAMLRGRPQTAARFLRQAAINFEKADAPGSHGTALALLAEADSQFDDVQAAAEALEEIPAIVPTVDFEQQRALLCANAGRGHLAAAIDTAVELADIANTSALRYYELMMTYAAMRLGSDDVTGRIVAVAGSVQGALSEAYGHHATALAVDDGAGLEEASEHFESLGCNLLAAESAMHAVLCYERSGRSERADAASTRVATLRRACEGAVTPLLSRSQQLSGLTRREHEVALLAADGLTSRRIAARLGVSIRTVDNQLGRVYTKLGLRGRAELATLLRR